MRRVAGLLPFVPLALALAWGGSAPSHAAQQRPPPRQAAPAVRTAPAPMVMQRPSNGNIMGSHQSFGGANVPGGIAGTRAPLSPPHIPGGMATAAAAGNANAAHLPSSVTAPHIPNGVAGPHMPGNVASHGPALPPAANTANATNSAHIPASLAAGHGPDFSGAHAGASPVAAHIPGAARGTVPFDRAREREVVLAHQHDFHTRDVRRFDEHEFAVWRRGGWHHEEHYGHYGWWWAVDDVRYPYDEPVYPYPLVVAMPDTVLAIPDQGAAPYEQ